MNITVHMPEQTYCICCGEPEESLYLKMYAGFCRNCVRIGCNYSNDNP